MGKGLRVTYNARRSGCEASLLNYVQPMTKVVLNGSSPWEPCVLLWAVGIGLLLNWGYCIATRRAGKKFRIESI